MDGVVQLVLLKYIILHITSMSELVTVLDINLGGAPHDPFLQKELPNTKDAVVEAQNISTAA